MILRYLAFLICCILLVCPAHASQLCHPTPPATIKIIPSSKDLEYVKNKSSAEVAEISKTLSNQISVHGSDKIIIKTGLYTSRTSDKVGIKFDIQRNQKTGTFCIAYEKIDYYFKRTPTLYLAKEHNSGQCARTVITHEQKHHVMDTRLNNEHLARVGKAIEKSVNGIKVIGPLPLSRVNELKQAMLDRVEKAIASTQDQRNKIYQENLKLIDNKEEYALIHRDCKKQTKQAYENIKALDKKYKDK